MHLLVWSLSVLASLENIDEEVSERTCDRKKRNDVANAIRQTFVPKCTSVTWQATRQV